jgi:hypothetical protein
VCVCAFCTRLDLFTLFHIWDVSPTFHFAVSVFSCDDLQDTTPGPVGCSVNPTVSHDS